MRLFPTEEVLSVTTGRLLCDFGNLQSLMEFIVGEPLFTHQLPRVSREIEPWLRSQYPALMRDSPGMIERLADLSGQIEQHVGNKQALESAISKWVADVRDAFGLPAELPVYEIGTGMHTSIDPIEEAKAIVGEDRVIAIRVDDQHE